MRLREWQEPAFYVAHGAVVVLSGSNLGTWACYYYYYYYYFSPNSEVLGFSIYAKKRIV